MSSCLSSPKVTIIDGDTSKFLAKEKSAYDVIISDSFDPVGPAKTNSTIFQLLYDALLPEDKSRSGPDILGFTSISSLSSRP